jgi:transcription-repair coupling factor (superfamily II helicase)
MTLAALTSRRLATDGGFAAVLGGAPSVVVPEAALAVAVGSLAALGSVPVVVVVTPTAGQAERVAHDLGTLLGPGRVALFPAWETLPFERVSPSARTTGARLAALARLDELGRSEAAGDPEEPGRAPLVLVASLRAMAQRIGARPEDLTPLRVQTGDVLERDELIRWLVEHGYRREPEVEHRGELALRGGILDVFPADGEDPVRIELFGDEVERISRFDPATQRSVERVEAVRVVGAREVLLSPERRARAEALLAEAPWGASQWERLAAGVAFDGMESWVGWLDPDPLVLADLVPKRGRILLVDLPRLRDRATELVEEERALAGALAETWGFPGGADEVPRLHLELERILERAVAPATVLSPLAPGPSVPSMGARRLDLPVGDPDRVRSELARLVSDGFLVLVAAEGHGSAERLAGLLTAGTSPLEVLEGEALDAWSTSPKAGAPGLVVAVAPLEVGVVLPEARLALVAEADLTGRRRAHRHARARPVPVEGFFDSLRPGDFVVHDVHGIGRYAGMVRRAIGGAERDYLLIEYRGDDKLYVPSDQLGALTPYVGGESPSLSRLGGSDWQRTRAKVRAAVREVAAELVELYRKRQVAEGHAFSPDTPWQAELESSFEFTETPDQAKAIAETKADMERPSPMDRLVLGDVGFGKTEVAIRAVFKAVQDGKQAAVLAPTTLLAHQHFQTFSLRYAGYPVRVEVLSRFLSPAQAKRTVEGLASGEVDVVIGTHRLLGSDVRFRDLGLLVVDEEQRFGVSHKEQIKRLSVGVDVLTLAATPIPRTMEMALTGLKDLTVIQTPPVDRQPILTYVGDYDERAVVEAIRRELLREGQVFFVHNRVRDIERVAARLAELVPEARIAVAHGQMDEGTLEQVVYDFWEGAYDVLVCTTIIESGIDMPAVNTLVVDRADRLGLGQLHQLRGRVGRAGQRAYAYLFHPADTPLGEEALERLRTIGEHTELGSGFRIAMRDLEIRGAGNLLGRDQSGHIAAVGYDLYVRMVSEALDEAKGLVPERPPEVKLDLAVDAYLPEDFIERDDARLEAYRRLAAVQSRDEVTDIAEEWRDRYGPLPEPAEALLEVGRLRAECLRLGITEVVVVPARSGAGAMGRATARLAPLALAMSATVRLRRLAPRAVYKEAAQQLVVPLSRPKEAARELAELLAELVPTSAAPRAADSIAHS